MFNVNPELIEASPHVMKNDVNESDVVEVCMISPARERCVWEGVFRIYCEVGLHHVTTARPLGGSVKVR